MSITNAHTGVTGQIVAAFDVGSNSIKMTVARQDPADSSDIEEFLWRSETVRLGQGIDQTGELALDRVEAALTTLTRFAAEAREAGATRLIGVATEATRIARNGARFLERVEDVTGIAIKSISGDREATLTFLGLRGTVDLDGPVAVADIGGGSTEIIIAHSGKILWSQSLPLGSGRLTDRHVHHDPPTQPDLAACRTEATGTIAGAPLERVTGGRLIIVGGTGEYLVRLIPEEARRTPDLLNDILSRLTSIPAAELATNLAIPEARARVLPAGIAIASAVAGRMSPAEFVAARSGIRRGLLLAAFAGEI